MVSPAIDMLSGFMTPWMKPTSCQLATRAAVRPTTASNRAACGLELDVAAHAVLIDDLAEQHRAAIAELRHPVAELMAGIGHGQRLGPVRHPVAAEDRRPVRRIQRPRVEPELPGQRLVQPDQ